MYFARAWGQEDMLVRYAAEGQGHSGTEPDNRCNDSEM